jgi:phosphoribosylamine--glycine ligase
LKVLVVGAGGREHALVWKLRQSPSVERVFCVPGNGGVAKEATCLPFQGSTPLQLAQLAAELNIDLTVVGPEGLLVEGLADHLIAKGIPVAGPAQEAARLEGSKIFAKEFMRRHKIPTADFAVCESQAKAEADLNRWGDSVVIKADGLAAGKGVIVASSRSEAEEGLESLI